jgi:hypothetical protein
VAVISGTTKTFALTTCIFRNSYTKLVFSVPLKGGVFTKPKHVGTLVKFSINFILCTSW